MLTALIDSTLELLRGTPQYEPVSSALWKYATTTLSYVPMVGIHHTVAYHRAAVEAASRSPPLYDPLVHGEIAPHQYLLHIQPHIGKTGIGRRSSKRARPSSGEPISPPSSKQSTSGAQRTPGKRSRTSSQVSDADHCSLHPLGSHTNAQCKHQQGNQPGARRSTPAATTPAGPTT
jgi:hypothetical protein